ncbi:hypothetical protein [Streptomyces sp. NPDC005209]|uniref:hypothetical protein n=1 Tax=Streptomyces sp. NPDC005209 TaxID=3156715 RepID=UPI0033B92CF6
MAVPPCKRTGQQGSDNKNQGRRYGDNHNYFLRHMNVGVAEDREINSTAASLVRALQALVLTE